MLVAALNVCVGAPAQAPGPLQSMKWPVPFSLALMVTLLPTSTTHCVVMPPTGVQLPPGEVTDTVPKAGDGAATTLMVTCGRTKVATQLTGAFTARSMTVGVLR